MNRLILLSAAVLSFSGAAASADDYLLRLDSIGYVAEPLPDKEPTEKVLRSIEVIARPQSTFHSKVTMGPELLTLTGGLFLSDDGSFKVHISYIHSLDTGRTVLREDGSRRPLPETTKVETRVTITEGGSVNIGGLDTQKSKNRYVLRLVKYEMADR